jgi:succinate dehydrogenase/fumarate reductase iron-sulfur protein
MNPPNESSDSYRLEVLRYDEGRDEPPRFQAYEIPAEEGTSLLSALLQIQDEQDPTLAFRCACRGLVCGSCGMVVNGQPTLACRTRLADLPTRRIVVEPLPGFEVIKDLVVDLEPFWEKYEQIQPWLHAPADPGNTRMSERQRERIDQFANCILCGLCYAACPAAAMNDEFTGPAALAKLYRFLADSREDRGPESLAAQNSNKGAWGCRMATRCVDVCPKNVRPLDGITGVRRKLVAQTLFSLLRWSRHEE